MKDINILSVHTRIESILNFVLSCGDGDHSLEDCPTMLEKINNKKNVHIFSSVKKCDVVRTKNLQVITRQGTKNGMDNPKISKINNKEDYPNPNIQKQLYNDASNMFQELVAHEVTNHAPQKMCRELINLINTDNFVAKLINLLYNLKNKSGVEKKAKSICSLNKKYESDVDPLVDLEIEG